MMTSDPDGTKLPVLRVMPQGWTFDCEAYSSHTHEGAFAVSSDGVRHYVKTYEHAGLAEQELLALLLYRECGANVPDGRIVELIDGRTAIATVALDGEPATRLQCIREEDWCDFEIVDEWLGNDDAFAQDFVVDDYGEVDEDQDDAPVMNTVVADGKIYRIDCGGALSTSEHDCDYSASNWESDVLGRIIRLGDRDLQRFVSESGLVGTGASDAFMFLSKRRDSLREHNLALVVELGLDREPEISLANELG